MSFRIVPTPTFAKSLKALAKRHKSIKEDMEKFRKSLEENPLQGTELIPGVRKIRMAIKSKSGGKSGGARVITYNVLATEQDGVVYLLEVYDKSEYSTVKENVLKDIIKNLDLLGKNIYLTMESFCNLFSRPNNTRRGVYFHTSYRMILNRNNMAYMFLIFKMTSY